MSGTRWYSVVAAVAAAAILIIFLYAVRGTLPPFLIAFAIAWLLDPVLDRLQRRGVRRGIAVLSIYGVFLIVFMIGLFYLGPAVLDQATQFGGNFSTYSARFEDYATGLMNQHHDTLARLKLPTTLPEVVAEYGDQASKLMSRQIGVVIGAVTEFLKSNFFIVAWIFVIPMVAFYLLMDIDLIRRKSVLLIPESVRPRTIEVMGRVGAVFSSYVRGLVVVCLLYGIVTTVVLVAFRLQYGIILGLLAGVLYAVPYLGAIGTTLLVFLVGLATYPHGVGQAIWPAVGMVVLNQAFDLVLTPKILGKSVGLHPVLSLFALLAGGQLFGLVGMILAVPVAASIQEIVFEFCPQLKPDPKPVRVKTRKQAKEPAAVE